MNRFTIAREAKEFLISKILAQADREKVSLTEVEHKMLYFSETGWTLPNIMEVSDNFDREYNQNDYEKKIARLIRNETKRLKKDDGEEFASWIGAIRRLKKEDHYLSVMIDRAGISAGPVTDEWKGGILGLVIVGAIVALGRLLYYVGGPYSLRTGQLYDKYTDNPRLDTIIGYALLSFIALAVALSIYAHVDRKRRIYKAVDVLLEGVIGLFAKRGH